MAPFIDSINLCLISGGRSGVCNEVYSAPIGWIDIRKGGGGDFGAAVDIGPVCNNGLDAWRSFPRIVGTES